MVSALTAYRFALAVATAASLALAGVAWHNRPKRGTRPLAGTMLAASWWLLATFFSWTATDPAAAMFWRKATFLGITLAVFFLVLFGLEYVGRSDLVGWRTVAALLVEPIVVNALVWTNHAHGLIWDPATTPGTPATLSYGPAFWGTVAYSYLVTAGVVVLLLVTTYRSQRFYRAQIVPLLVGVIAPVLSNLAFFLLGPRFDLAPLSFAVTGAAFTYAVFRQEFLDLGPVARDRIIEEMDDPVLALDGDGRVIDCNPAARRLCDCDPFGETTEALYGVDLLERLSEDSAGEVAIEREGHAVHFDLRASDLGGEAAPGHLLVLRDITDLTERERELDLLKRVTSRFLRHNLRNQMTVVTGHANDIIESTDGPISEQAETIRRTGERVVEMSAKARVVESVVDRGDERRRIDAAAVVRDRVDALEERFPDATFEVDAPSVAPARASPFLDEAVENLLENGVVHNDATEPRVSVDVTRHADRVTVRIRDNGPGIPATEIDAVRSGDEGKLNHGTGIGLFLVRWIVEKSRGELAFEADEGVAIVHLPAADSG
ncbi:MAG: histidine kinase N-terminal 7TM domain-containing protein [Haloarculaceae archaeon]